MTYKDLITKVSNEVRDRAWPEPDGSVTQEQVDISYAAVLAKAVELPIYELEKDSSTLAGSGATVNNGYLTYDLPSDLFTGREDFGVLRHTFDSVEHDVSQSMPINSLRMMASNSLHSGNSSMFSYDIKNRTLNILSTDNTQDVDLAYSPRPARPTTSNYSTEDVPLPESQLQPVIHMIANHISGSRMRDAAGAQFQGILTNMYSKSQPVPQE